MSNKKGFSLIEFLISLIMVTLVSGTIFWLTYAGVIPVKMEEEKLLMPLGEMLPFYSEKVLEISEFKFCQSVDQFYQCQNESDKFKLGQYVTFRFKVRTETVYNQIKLVENFRVIAPNTEVVYEAKEENKFVFQAESKKNEENILFKDFFYLKEDFPSGTYLLELIIENPLIEKKINLVKKFEVE